MPLPTTGQKYTDLTAASTLSPLDMFCIVQNSSNTSLSVLYELIQFYIQGALTYVNSTHTISGLTYGIMGDASAGTFAVTLPSISGWTGGDLIFLNVGPSGTFTIAAAGADAILSNGSPVASITSPAAGYGAVILRPFTPGGTGVTGWYLIDQTISTVIGSPTTALTSNGLLAVGTPTVAAGAGLGTSPPAPTITGNDQSGYVTFTPGTLPSASSTVVTVTFGKTWAVAPKAVILGAGSTNVMGVDFAAPPSGYATTGFTISVGTVALAAGTYIIPYACF
jgi:hypothetical protein